MKHNYGHNFRSKILKLGGGVMKSTSEKYSTNFEKTFGLVLQKIFGQFGGEEF